jgi:uncharacterized protein
MGSHVERAGGVRPVTEEHRNYGIEPEGSGIGGSGTGGGLGTSTMGSRDENTWSVLAHLSIFLNIFTGFLGPVAAFVIWLMYKDRSPTVSFHALQSLWYQVAWMVILVVGWTVTGLLTMIIIGFFLIPVMLLITLVPFAHAAYAAYRVNQGVDYRYLWALDLIGRDRRIGA